MKTRANDTDTKFKKKYFRQPKIYQNDYVEFLYTRQMFRDFQKMPDKNNLEYMIVFIFFVHKKEHYMLVGRDDAEKYNSDESKSSRLGSSKGSIDRDARKYRTTQDKSKERKNEKNKGGANGKKGAGDGKKEIGGDTFAD